VADVFQLVIHGTCAGELFENVQHWQSSITSSSDPVSLAAELITAFRASAEGPMLDMMSGDTFITGYKCKRVNAGGSPTVMLPITPVAGTASGTSATSSTATCIVTRYSQAGKWRSGRWFVPGLSEDELTGNTFSAGQLTAANTFIAAMGVMVATLSTWTFGVWAGKTSTFFPPVYIAPSPKVGIQKRRLLPVL